MPEEDGLADRFRTRRATGLPGDDHIMPERFQPRGEAPDLRGFAGPLPAFQRNEESAHPLSLPKIARRTAPEASSQIASSARWVNVP